MTLQTSEADLLLAQRLPTGYTARPPTLDDVTAVVDIINRCSQKLLGEDESKPDYLSSEWQMPGFQLAANARLVLAPGGEPAGYAHLWDAEPHVQIEQFGRVHPGQTGRGLGSYLLGWIENRARELAAGAPPAMRVTMTDWVNSLDTAAHALLRDQGYQPVRANMRMTIYFDPASPPPAPAWPAGVSVRSFVPGQ